MQNERYFVPSLARGLEILSGFSEAKPSQSLSELAQRLGLGRSSVYRLAHTLTQLGYLEFDEETKRYTPTAKVLTLAADMAASMALSTAALPHLRELARRFNETVNLGTLVGHHVIFVQRIESHQILTTRFQVGSQLPACCSALGKTILAYLPLEEARAILSSTDLVPVGPKTITDLDELLDNLAQIREQGFGLNDEELTAGLHAVAAPIRSGKGEIVAAVDVSTLIIRVPRQRLVTEVAQAVMETADRISVALGAPEI